MAALFAHEAFEAHGHDFGILYLWSTDELVKLGHQQTSCGNTSFHEAEHLLKAVNLHSSDPDWLRDLQEPLTSTRFETEDQDIRQAVIRILQGVQHFTAKYCEKHPEQGKYPVEELPDSGTVLIQAAHELLYEEKHNIVHGHVIQRYSSERRASSPTSPDGRRLSHFRQYLPTKRKSLPDRRRPSDEPSASNFRRPFDPISRRAASTPREATQRPVSSCASSSESEHEADGDASTAVRPARPELPRSTRSLWWTYKFPSAAGSTRGRSPSSSAISSSREDSDDGEETEKRGRARVPERRRRRSSGISPGTVLRS